MDYALESTFDIKFNTRTTADPPVLITFAGTPAVEIYEDNSTTQITGATTLTVDFDGVTGLHNLRIAATAANGFEAGKSYAVVVSSGTVDGNSVVGETLFNFTIGRSAAKATADAIKAKTDSLSFNGMLLTVDVKAWDEIALDSTDPFDNVALETSVQTVISNQGTIATAITNLNDPALGDIVDAVLEEPVADHQLVSGSLAEFINGINNAASAASSNSQTILDRLGGFAASGTNTVLGFFRALLRADAPVPSDVGGTYAASTDSLEAIRDRGDTDWTTGGGASLVGPGADSVTITIKDDDIPEPNVDVWIALNSNGTNVIAGTLTTNDSGQVTFLLDAGSVYYLFAKKAGKISIRGQQFTAVAD
jgi:hypothetical protein